MTEEYDFLIEEEKDENKNSKDHNRSAYKILIIDDEEDVHLATKLALRGMSFEDVPLTFLSAYSAEEAKEILQNEMDIGVILLDVVMESDHAGLLLVDYIRNTLNNKNVRIILRTGQPGIAVEEKVIVDYDINDYKEKSELTRKKLFTAVYSSLRAYKYIISLVNTQKGMTKIIESTSDLFDISERSFQGFIESLIQNLNDIHDLSDSSSSSLNSFFVHLDREYTRILTATGKFKDYTTMSAKEIDNLIHELNLTDVIQDNRNILASITEKNELIFMHKSVLDRKSLFYQTIDTDGKFEELSKLYLLNCILGIDNFFTKRDMLDSQMESLFILSDTIELRSAKTANHVKRVAAQVEIMAKALSFDENEISNMKFSSMLHDIGKIGIPDEVLLKPARLTTGEFEIIKTHTRIGYNLLKQSKLPLMSEAALIALYHHENWDGNGYPENLSATDIPLSARIVSIIDVFDALVTKRVYKEAWSFEDALEYILAEKSSKFDPDLVDVFASNINQIKETYKLYPNDILKSKF